MIFDSLELLESATSRARNLVISSTQSVIPTPGELWFDSVAGVLNCYDGSTWVAIIGSTSNIDASQISSGTFANARIAASNVTQHQGALNILEGQITNGSLLARNADDETITGNWSFSNPVTVAAPSSNSHAATKQYVDSVAQGLTTKPSVRAATTGNLTATYSNGTLGVGATLTFVGPLPAIDGISLSVGNGVLVKNQTNAAENGRYVVTQLNPGILTRCGLCDEASEIPGAYIFVVEGTQAATGWVQTVADTLTFVVGTDPITVTQFSSAGSYAGGFGIDITGNTISVDGSSTAAPSSVMLRDATGSTAVANLTASGNIIAGGSNLVIGEGLSTGQASIEIGRNRTGDAGAWIDFWAAATPGDYNARIARNTGVNGTFELRQRGTGSLRLAHENTGNIEFNINNTILAVFNSAGNLVFQGASGISWSPALPNFYINANIGTGNPGINFDSDDFIDYNRVTNRMRFFIGASEQLAIQSGVVSIPSSTASTSKTTGALTVAGGVGVSGNLYATNITGDAVTANTATGMAQLATDAGGSLSLGRIDNVSSTPYIDFNSGSTTVDRDARIQVTGGSGVVDGGNLDIRAGFISMVGGVLETVNDLGVNVSGNVTLSFKSGNYVAMTLTGTTVLSLSDFPSSNRVGTMVLEITNGGAHSLTWPAGLTWVSGSAPVLRVVGTNLVGIIARANGTILRGTLIA